MHLVFLYDEQWNTSKNFISRYVVQLQGTKNDIRLVLPCIAFYYDDIS